MKALFRIPFLKFCAVTAALACAGGGVMIGRGGPASGSTTPPPITLDHYLCVFGGRGPCDPVPVTLPNGTTFGVDNPNDGLVCDSSHHWNAGGPAPATVSVSNEFSPSGSASVTLAERRLDSICTITATQHFGGSFGHSRARPHAVVLATFSCYSATYPSRGSVHFAPPSPVTVGTRLHVRVNDPTEVCLPAVQTNGPTPSVDAADPTQGLVCFETRLDTRFPFFFFGPEWQLCVPSYFGNAPTGASTTTSTQPPSTTTTTKPPATTTTTKPPTTTTMAPTTTTTKPPATTTTTTMAPTTTSTAPPATTTTSHPQPCAGVLLPDGTCIITV